MSRPARRGARSCAPAARCRRWRVLRNQRSRTFRELRMRGKERLDLARRPVPAREPPPTTAAGAECARSGCASDADALPFQRRGRAGRQPAFEGVADHGLRCGQMPQFIQCCGHRPGMPGALRCEAARRTSARSSRKRDCVHGQLASNRAELTPRAVCPAFRRSGVTLHRLARGACLQCQARSVLTSKGLLCEAGEVAGVNWSLRQLGQFLPKSSLLPGTQLLR